MVGGTRPVCGEPEEAGFRRWMSLSRSRLSLMKWSFANSQLSGFTFLKPCEATKEIAEGGKRHK